LWSFTNAFHTELCREVYVRATATVPFSPTNEGSYHNNRIRLFVERQPSTISVLPPSIGDFSFTLVQPISEVGMRLFNLTRSPVPFLTPDNYNEGNAKLILNRF